MPLALNLPSGYGHVNMLFGGTGAPHGAAITFGVNQVALTATQVATAVNAAYNTALKSAFATEVTLMGTRAKLGPMEDGPFSYVSSGVAGTAGSGAGATQVAYLIRKNTAQGGRQGAGRIYQPGVWEAAVDSAGAVSSAALTVLQTAWNNFFSALITANVPMTLLHSDGGYPKLVDGSVSIHVVLPKAPTAVTSLSVDGTVATQRRRLRG